jgi:hypothetical protein
MEGETQTLFTQDTNTGEYVEFTPPEPKPFLETLDEGLRESEHLKGFENANDLAKTLVEVRSARVTPETADGYEYTAAEGQQIDAERLNTWKSKFFDMGLSQDQFGKIMAAVAEEEATGRAAFDKSIEDNRAEAEAALQTKWGDKTEENTQGALRFRDAIIAEMGDKGKAFVDFLEDTKFGDNPQVVEFFHQCSTLISEDAIKRGSPRPHELEVKRSESGDPMLDDYKDMDKTQPQS